LELVELLLDPDQTKLIAAEIRSYILHVLYVFAHALEQVAAPPALIAIALVVSVVAIAVLRAGGHAEKQ
jgi:hypothetical protein